MPCFAKYWPEGIYETPPLDAGQVERQRIELDLGVEQPVDVVLPFGAARRPARVGVAPATSFPSGREASRRATRGA